MLSQLVSAAVLLLLVLDPFGNVPLVLSALAHVPPERRRAVILRECAAAYLVLVAFLFGGRFFLDLLGLSDVALTMAGGIILFLIALHMVFPREGVFAEAVDGEPFLVPIAIPWIAGPSALATVMLMTSREPQRLLGWFAALTCAMLATTAVLVAAPALERVLGRRALGAIERLMGLVLTAIAVQMMLNGLRAFFGS